MINHVVTTSNLDMYSLERAEKIVEGTVYEFCLIFSSIGAVSLKLGRGVAK